MPALESEGPPNRRQMALPFCRVRVFENTALFKLNDLKKLKRSQWSKIMSRSFFLLTPKSKSSSSLNLKISVRRSQKYGRKYSQGHPLMVNLKVQRREIAFIVKRSRRLELENFGRN